MSSGGLAVASENIRIGNDELTSEELLAAGWPGEIVDRAAGNARVRVALSKLRALGLRDLLVRGDYGYTFADTVDVVSAE